MEVLLEIYFKEPELKDWILEYSVRKKGKLVREFGPKVAQRVNQRIADILACLNLTMLKDLHKDFEELKFKRKGQYSLRVGGGYRLIFEPYFDPSSL